MYYTCASPTVTCKTVFHVFEEGLLTHPSPNSIFIFIFKMYYYFWHFLLPFIRQCQQKGDETRGKDYKLTFQHGWYFNP